METTAPKLNADLQIPDPNPSLDPTGWVDSWIYDPDPTTPAAQASSVSGQPAPRRRGSFSFGDGSVRFLKDSIDLGSPNYADNNPGVYRKLSTKAGGEVISADAY